MLFFSNRQPTTNSLFQHTLSITILILLSIIMFTSASGFKSKVIYLIRHAETDENRRMHGLQSFGKSIQKCQLPSGEDFKLGMHFLGMTLRGVTDAKLSIKGRNQILEMHDILAKERSNFADTLDVIAHSPLGRAKETCYGVFGLYNEDPIQKLNIPVIELSCLEEITPWEIATQGKKPVRKRIKALESWIESQDDANTIAIVGHSEYFMIMLGIDEKFQNCDVWKVQYDGNGQWTNLDLKYRLKSSDEEAIKWTSGRTA